MKNNLILFTSIFKNPYYAVYLKLHIMIESRAMFWMNPLFSFGYLCMKKFSKFIRIGGSSHKEN